MFIFFEVLMKKILIVFGFLLILSISGCTGQALCHINPELDACQITYTPVTGDMAGEIQNDEVLSVVNMTQDFDFSITSLSTFSFTENPGIAYVDVEEFLYVMHEGLVYYTISYGESVEVEYKVNYSGSIFGAYAFLMELNPTENTIYFNDMNFTSEFNIAPGFDHEPNISTVSGDYVEGVLEKTIDLNDYNILMKEEDGILFIPMYLANVLLTGSYINVYQNGLNLYIVDDFSLLSEQIVDEASLPEDTDPLNLIENSANFISMYFDYFYGLKEYFGIDSYKALFQSLGLYDVLTIAEFDEILFSYIYSLSDLHTSIYSLGYDSADANLTFPEENERLNQFYDAYYSDTCTERELEFDFKEFPDYYILEINEFTFDTLGYLQSNLVDLDSDKPIFIDLACNPGGSLLAVLELIAYLTDEPFEFQYTITSTGEIYKQTYESTNDTVITNEFYLFTSKASYSATNLFVSMVKDNQLATIIGEKTSGGACAVVFAVLPNNMVITHASAMAMLNASGEIIEDGIEPDIYYSNSIDIDDLILEVENYYSLHVDSEIIDSSFNNVIDIAVDLSDFPVDSTFFSLEIEVFNSFTSELISTNQYSTDTFHFQLSMDSEDPIASIFIYVNYEYLGITTKVLVYEATFDPSS